MHQIVMGLLVREEKVLLAHRHPDREWYPNVWDLAGGHVEAGEDPADALRRELHEELGIRARIDDEPLLGLQFGEVDAAVWRVTEWVGEIQNCAPTEHDDIGWFSLGELNGLAIADPAILEICRLAVLD